MGQESPVLTFEPFAEENHQVEEQPKMAAHVCFRGNLYRCYGVYA